MDRFKPGILNKKETGCGATSVVLENNQNVVVCCPTIQLIESKISQYPNERCPYRLKGVKKGVSFDDIMKYIEKCKDNQPVKIMTTYDSYPRVAGAIGEDIDNYHILVDEYQEILDAVIYRNPAIKNLLRELKDNPSVTYISATPISNDYKPQELIGLPEYEVHWPNAKKTKLYRCQTDSPFTMAVNIIRSHKAGMPLKIGEHNVKEYFFFVNSVRAISQIIKVAKLTPEEVKIVCSDSEINNIKLDGFKINKITDHARTFTFCTKTVFYGADFYSDAGLIIIVSDNWHKSSLLDISTDIRQIAGRIRNEDNPFKGMIFHIHSVGVLQTRDEFESEMQYYIEEAQKDIKAYNFLPDDLKEVIIKKIEKNEPEALSYYDPTCMKVLMDDLKIKYRYYKFEAIDTAYRDGIELSKTYEEGGFEEIETWFKNIKNKVFSSGKDEFQNWYLDYSNERKKYKIGKSKLAEDIELQFPLIPQAFHILGDDVVEMLGYDEDKIRKEAHYNDPTTQSALKKELGENFIVGEDYINAASKPALQKIYDKLHINRRAKTSDLVKFFTIKKSKIKNPETGKNQDSMKIISKLFAIFRHITHK